MSGSEQQPLWGSVDDVKASAVSWEVHRQDAFSAVQNLKTHAVDLIVTSPPYWGQRTYKGSHNWGILDDWIRAGGSSSEPPEYAWYVEHGGQLGMEPTPDWFVAHLVEFFSLARRVLKPTGSIWVNLGDTYFARWSSIRDRGRQGLGDHPRQRRRVPMGGYRQEKQLLLVPSRFAIAMQNERWILRNDMIWHKPNVPPRPERDRLKLSHEHFFHFVHRPKVGRARYFYDQSQTEARGNDVVLVNARPGQDGHSATFPAELVTPRILSSSPAGGTVLDPFCGTGRSLAIALANGRNAIGFEISREFATVAERQLKEVSTTWIPRRGATSSVSGSVIGSIPRSP